MKRAGKNGLRGWLERSGSSQWVLAPTLLVGNLVVGNLGCASSAPAFASNREASHLDRPEDPGIRFPDGPPRRLEHLTLPVEMAVPSPSAWQRQPQRDTLRLIHAATETVVELRYWTTQRLATSRSCEDELTLRSGEFERRRKRYLESDAVTTRAFAPASDHVGELTAKVAGNLTAATTTTRNAVANGATTAWVHGVAVGLGHCLTFDAETTVHEAAGERELAKRVAVLVDVIAASIRLQRVEDRGHTSSSTSPDLSGPRPAEVPQR
ncbi:MAG: hypothetical protein QM784_00960 [Polyangiaceae bacterium]